MRRSNRAPTQPCALAHQERLSWTSAALLAWSWLYALPHLYWGLGGTAGFFALKPSAPDVRGFEVANLVAFVAIALVGFIGFALQRTRRHRVPRMALLAIAGAGSAISVAHGVYGILFRAASVIGLGDVEGQPFQLPEHAWVLWDMLTIEPWFVGQGILLGLVGYLAQRSPAAGVRWLSFVGAAFLMAIASAALGLRVG